MDTVGGDGLDEEGEGVSLLLAAGFDGGQQAFHESATVGALGAERQVFPDDGVAQRAFGRVVGRLDIRAIHEPPQVALIGQQFTTRRSGAVVGAG